MAGLRSAVLLVLAAVALLPLAAAKWHPGRFFDRILIIVLENAAYNNVINDPYFFNISSRTNPNGRLLTGYSGIGHPSQPNYVAMIAGSNMGITDDEDHNVDGISLVDLLEAKHIKWKGYMENYPGGCNTDSFIGFGLYYARKHNPFISFTQISGNATRCARIQPSTRFHKDLANKKLPQYMYYVPNNADDGHDTDITTASAWLQSFLEPLLADPWFRKNTLVVVTYDEDDHSDPGNHIYTALIGDVVTNNIADPTSYNHYSLLKTVEHNWHLGNLGRNDANHLPKAYRKLRKPVVV